MLAAAGGDDDTGGDRCSLGAIAGGAPSLPVRGGGGTAPGCVIFVAAAMLVRSFVVYLDKNRQKSTDLKINKDFEVPFIDLDFVFPFFDRRMMSTRFRS